MEYIKYHPLVDIDTDGTEKTPVFCYTDLEAVIGHHKLYLEEIVPRRYRLCSSSPMTAAETSGLSIHCPYCGHALQAISSESDGIRHALYVCSECE